MSKAQVSKDLGLSNGTLGRWVEEFQADNKSSFPGQGNASEQRKKIMELEKENKQLKMERDILKKAIAFFANDGK